MKKTTALLAAIAALAASAVMAFGAVQDFGAFTIDVPAGWTAERDGETVAFTKNDNTASMSITYDTTDGASIKEIADAFVDALKGKGLKKDGDGYTFTMTNENGVESKCFIAGDNKNYALIVVTGGENAPDDVAAMMDSLTEK